MHYRLLFAIRILAFAGCASLAGCGLFGPCQPEQVLPPDVPRMPPNPVQQVMPAKTITLDLMGIHDPDSDAYNGNCIGCHGDRTDEVALDGVTPSAHARMAGFFGEGNDRCVACHNRGPNFYNFALGFGSFSKGGLREQVDMSTVGCANCHGANSTPSFYAQ